MKTATQIQRKSYAGYGGRVFRVVKAGKTGLWWAAGRRRGVREMFLDKLGPRPDADEMQKALDAMAQRQGWRAVQA